MIFPIPRSRIFRESDALRGISGAAHDGCAAPVTYFSLHCGSDPFASASAEREMPLSLFGRDRFEEGAL